MNPVVPSGTEDLSPPSVALQPAPVVKRPRRRAVRLQQSLALTFALLFGAGILGWYYSRLRSAPPARTGIRDATLSELILPPLATADGNQAASGGTPSTPTAESTETETAAAPTTNATAPALVQMATGATPIGIAPVDSRTSDKPDTAATSAVFYRLDTGRPVPAGTALGPERVEDANSGSLARLLTSGGAAPALATRLPSRTLLLPKGATVPCTLETAIDSQLPGLVTCVTSVDVYGADGQVVLLDRGTALLGEARSDVRSGQSRVFVLWTEARTPTGVVVPLASPATDALGRAGVPGSVNTHFFARFGAAILISVLDGAAQRGGGRGGTTVIYSPQATEAVLTEVLRSTLGIPPTINVAPGERLQVLVARDLDFRDVYRIRGVP